MTGSAGRRSKRPHYEEDNSEEFVDDEDSEVIRTGKNWSSARKVHMVVSKFNELKKNLVRNIGFGAILDMPLFNKVDRKFTVWLLSSIDCLRRVIVVNGEDLTDMVDMDVQRILGIPRGSRAVCGLNQDQLGGTEFEFHNLKSSELFIKNEYPDGMDNLLMDKFKMAFVVFVMGTFLAPTSKYNAVNPDFFGSLIIPSEIEQYNWAGYVLDRLMDAAARIIYLETLRTAPPCLPGKGSPRVNLYDCERIRKMIQSDKASCSTYTDNPSWGCSQAHPKKVSNASQGVRVASSSTIGQNIHADQRSTHLTHDAESTDLLQSLPILQSNLTDVLRQHCGNKLAPLQVSALRWFSARTTKHINQLKATLIKDQITLVEKLVSATEAARPLVESDGYASGNESATEDANPRHHMPPSVLRNNQSQPHSEVPPVPARQAPNSQALSLGSDPNSNRAGHNEAIACPCNSAPLLMPSCSFKTPIAAARQTMSTGIDDVQIPPIDPAATEQPDPKEGNVLVKTNTGSQSQVLVAPVSAVHNTAPPSGLDLLGTTTACFAGVGATPKLSELSNFYAAYQTPEHFIKNSSVAPSELNEIMSYGGVFARILAAESPSNKDAGAWDDEFTEEMPVKRTLVEGKIVKSHWFCGYEHPKRQHDILSPLWSSLSELEAHELQSIWVDHKLPKSIKLSGKDFKDVLSNGDAMSYDFCDIAMRRFNQLDSSAYPEGADVRWRHFLESDFATFAIAGECTWKSKSIQNQFLGEQVTYNLNRCRMIIIPALVTLTWCCYIFDFKDNVIHIVDPIFRPGTEAIMDKIHEHSAVKLQAALANCIQEFFVGWAPHWNLWSRKYVPAMSANCTTMESGIRTLIAARDYDGSKLVNSFSMQLVDRFKKSIIYEMLSLDGNQAKLPSSYVHSLDD
ncbi:unnamed protein product [Urochloa decumbens]|uniref:Uncharacterized protein n=1 Tax=Urochloa decumbens TaxID=240449 RepID=A0ABC9CZG8_9POAL